MQRLQFVSPLAGCHLCYFQTNVGALEFLCQFVHEVGIDGGELTEQNLRKILQLLGNLEEQVLPVPGLDRVPCAASGGRFPPPFPE